MQGPDLTYSNQNFKYYSQDGWGGHAIRIFNGNTENERTSNLILAARALFVQYEESPDQVHDSINFYTGEKFFLAESVFPHGNSLKINSFLITGLLKTFLWVGFSELPAATRSKMAAEGFMPGLAHHLEITSKSVT
ncbi:hypothetical protein [Flavobacterium sp. 3HN19-14]|uniref:hypothetical protein n=1 Tax=Flavobacterium sp. 3HN19-14 TaxID=3448133 RepID=UPI003EDF27D1